MVVPDLPALPLSQVMCCQRCVSGRTGAHEDTSEHVRLTNVF